MKYGYFHTTGFLVVHSTVGEFFKTIFAEEFYDSRNLV